MCACFTSKLHSSSAGQEEEDQAVFICVCECHVGAANDTEGLRVHWHLWSTHMAYYRLDLQTGGAPVAPIGVGRDEPPGSECAPNAALVDGAEESPGTGTLQFHAL